MLRRFQLTDQQIEAFRRSGYVLTRRVFNAQDMAQIDTWAREVENTPADSGRYWVYGEKSRLEPARTIVCRIENITSYHPGFQSLSAILQAATAQLLGEPATLLKDKINFKMPGGDGFKPHQDQQAGWDKYADFFISAMVCIDEATIKNGCLQMVSGYHRHGLFRSWEPLTSADMVDMTFVPIPTEPGDVVFFDCYTPHTSEPNLTNTTRRLFFATYNAASKGSHMQQYYADKYKNFPPDADRDPNKEYRFRV
ncbi:hypothetical protein RIEGSTA812A_PEG_1049 [invertebrate metagenome]|uniref:Phytanoyl-CoA dioxygenase n=1 Tax=invertebrate metagenome TaxID=1711999 RepID=A0A484H654_9ZZZZ